MFSLANESKCTDTKKHGLPRRHVQVPFREGKDAEEEAAACGQSRSKAEVLQKTGRLRDLHHTLSSEEVNKGFNWVQGLVGITLFVTGCTSYEEAQQKIMCSCSRAYIYAWCPLAHDAKQMPPLLPGLQLSRDKLLLSCQAWRGKDITQRTSALVLVVLTTR